jgi:hypothetical protein
MARTERDRERGEISATQNAVSCRTGTASTLPGMMICGYCSTIVKLLEIAFSCSEMYGRMPITAMTVTTPPSSALLP